MNNKGFVTSALLYGVLSLFLVLVLGTIAVIGNRKITNDKIKQSALDDVQDLTTSDNCFTYEWSSTNNNNYTITGYDVNCPKTVYIPEKINGVIVDEIGDNAFSNKGIENVTIKSNIVRISDTAFTGNGTQDNSLLFIFKGTMPHAFNGAGASNYVIRQD